ncbi:hypothetical protein BJ912DRAFT_1152140 [Pholiota molesta]|nr:hypothetical protein BJ912DRAFT_1152140 [Pholiota molesta]
MSELVIPVDIAKSEIGGALIATVLHVFLMGMYIVIYIGTMYTYVRWKPSNQRIVPAILTIQCLSSTAYTSLQWYELKRQFVDNGDTLDSIFLSLYATPEWLLLASDLAISIVLVLADGLLIWRCFFLWDRSFRIILLPLFLLCVEIGLFLVQPVLRAVYNNLSVSPTLARTFNDLVAMAYFSTFATSLVTTALIAYKILTHSRFSRKRYGHILDIVVQSGAVYSLTALATAISGVLPGGSDIRHTRSSCPQNYIQALSVYVSGLSATIMVARVVLSADTVHPTTTHFSGLHFHTPTDVDFEEGPNNTIPNDVNTH